MIDLMPEADYRDLLDSLQAVVGPVIATESYRKVLKQCLEREQWIREAVRLMELSQYNVENGYYDDELAAELRKHVEKVKL